MIFPALDAGKWKNSRIWALYHSITPQARAKPDYYEIHIPFPCVSRVEKSSAGEKERKTSGSTSSEVVTREGITHQATAICANASHFPRITPKNHEYLPI